MRALGFPAAAVALALATLSAAPAPAGQTIQLLRERAEIVEGPRPTGPPPALAPGTGVVAGRVIDAASDRAVGGAIVTLSLPGVLPLRVMADGQGQFAFRDLPAGRFALRVEKRGYSPGGFGQHRPGGESQPLDLRDGERRTDAILPLWRFAAVSGKVTDAAGEPLVGLTVHALVRQFVSGRPRFVPRAADVTDDRGWFRIGSLEPGRYVVAVSGSGQEVITQLRSGTATGDVVVAGFAPAAVTSFGERSARSISVSRGSARMPAPGTTPAGLDANGRELSFPIEFYPGAPSAAGAGTISLGAGEERTGIDFALTPIATRRISGVVAGGEGPQGGLLVTLSRDEAESAVTLETMTAAADGLGTFSFDDVAPGRYVLRAFRQALSGGLGGPGMVQAAVAVDLATGLRGSLPPLPPMLMGAPAGGNTRWAEATVTIGSEDVEGISLLLRRAVTLSGRVEFIGGAKPPDSLTARLPVWVEPIDPQGARPGAWVRGVVQPDGRFELPGVVPGRYVLRASALPPDWHFRGATQAGRDISDVPFDVGADDMTDVLVSFTDRTTRVSGDVTGSASAVVIVMPADAELWTDYGANPRRLRMARPDADARYAIADLPPGRYYVVAVEEATAGDWQDPEFLGELAGRATPFLLGDGQSLNISLRVNE